MTAAHTYALRRGTRSSRSLRLSRHRAEGTGGSRCHRTFPLASDGNTPTAQSAANRASTVRVPATIRCGGAPFTAKEVYANKDMVNHHGGVVLVDGHLYGFSDGGKGWSCLDFATGAVASQWQGGIGKGTLTRAGDRFYLRAESGPGTLVLMDASPAGWKEAGRFDPPDRSAKNSWPHLVIANGRLFVRDQDVLLCYRVQGSVEKE